MHGQAGADLFVFTSIFDSLAGPGASFDRIMDFSRAEGDKIDLSAIDANVNTAGDAAFSFIGTASFSKKAGELRFDVIDGQVRVFADTDGDGVADFTFAVTNIQSIEAVGDRRFGREEEARLRVGKPVEKVAVRAETGRKLVVVHVVSPCNCGEYGRMAKAALTLFLR
jgi:hypothetical protein